MVHFPFSGLTLTVESLSQSESFSARLATSALSEPYFLSRDRCPGLVIEATISLGGEK